MEDLFKSFADELEERKLSKGINPTSFNPLKNRGSKGKDKSMDDLIREGKIKDKDANGPGHTKSVEHKRKELVDAITEDDLAPGGIHHGQDPAAIREMHEYNHSSDELSDKDIHEDHKRVFPKQY